MRSPVIAFGILAATVSPSLIAAAPASASPNLPSTGTVTGASHNVPVGALPPPPPVPGAAGASPLGFLSGIPASRKRADDSGTAGGNARTGNTASSDGGSVLNNADETETMTNDDSSKQYSPSLHNTST